MISLVFAHSVGRAWLNVNLEEQNPVSPVSVVTGRQDHEILIVCVKSPPLCLIHRWCASVSAFSHRAQLKLWTLVLFAWEPSMHPAGGQLCHRCWVWAWQMTPASWLSPWHLASALKTPVLFLFDTLVFFFFLPQSRTWAKGWRRCEMTRGGMDSRVVGRKGKSYSCKQRDLQWLCQYPIPFPHPSFTYTHTHTHRGSKAVADGERK